MQVQKTKPGYKLVKSLFGKYDEIPVDWKSDEFSKYSEIFVGHVGPTSEFYREDGILFLRTLNVKENFPDLTDVKFISKDFHEKLKKSQLHEEDILISRVGISGVACIIPKNFPEANCANVLILRTKNTMIPKFVCYLLNSNIVTRQVHAKEAGAVQAVLNAKTLEKLVIPIPLINEQQKIGSILSNVDSLISSYDDIIQKTKVLNKGLMQKLLTKGIGHTKFKNYSYGLIPSEWEFVSLGKICKKITDGTHHSPINLKKGDYLYITSKNLRPWGMDLSHISYVDKKTHLEIYSRCNPEKNDVLYVKDGVGTGLAVVNPFDFEFSMLSSVALLKPNYEKLDSNYLMYQLNYPPNFERFTGEMVGTAIRRLTLQLIKLIKIPLPSLKEQQKIASILSNIDAKIIYLESIKSQLEILKKGLMQKLLTGQIRV